MLLKAFVRSLAVALVVLSSTTYAATIYVSTTGSDTNNGLSWSAARKTVQAGLNAAQSGDQVWVAAGTYTHCITLKAGVALYGGFTGSETDLSQRDWTSNVTILDGNGGISVVTGPSGATATTRVDGFTIRNGFGDDGGGVYLYYSSPTIVNNIITGNYARDGEGGGLYLYYSSSTIANNTITGNKPTWGGGLYVEGGSPAILNNIIKGNSVGGYGGGIYLWLCSPTISGNTITENSGSGGGGVYVGYGCSPLIVNNTITDNSVTGTGGRGGGLWLDTGSSPIITGNNIKHNSSSYGGGGLYLYSSPHPAITNNTIAENNAGIGGGLYMEASHPTMTNNTIVGNNAASDGGGLYLEWAYPTIDNTIIAFNSSGIYQYTSDGPSYCYSCIYGNTAYNFSSLASDPTGTNGNVSLDPQFVRTPNPGPDGKWGTADDILGDLHLQAGSPCINAGDPAFVPTPGQTDLAGLPRVLYGRVDIGAYEYRLAGDINFDGSVNVADLQTLVTAWASQAGPPAGSNWNASADLNSDGYVNVGDLQILVANWGRPG